MNQVLNSVTASELESLIVDMGNFRSLGEPAAPTFGLKQNLALKQFHATKGKDKVSRKHLKKLIKSDNALFLRDYIPKPGETTHAVVRGDFVFADLIPVFLDKSNADLIAISTLGMSKSNAESMLKLKESGRCKRLSILVSHYFSRVDKTSTFSEVKHLLNDDIRVARTHAKVILIDSPPNAYVLAGSANLRSSDNVEQFSAWNDKELLVWYWGWMQEIQGDK